MCEFIDARSSLLLSITNLSYLLYDLGVVSIARIAC